MVIKRIKERLRFKTASLFDELLATIDNSWITGLISILVIACILSIPLFSLTGLDNAKRWLGKQTQQKQITLFLQTDTEQERSDTLERITNLVKRFSNVVSEPPKLISRDQALTELKAAYGNNNVQDAIDLFDYNPLHDVIVLIPNSRVSIAQLNDLKQQLIDDAMVYEININEAWVAHIQRLIDFSEKITWIVIIVFFISIWIVLNHALNLQINKRHQEIQIKILLGATNTQLYTPFIIWGTLLGFAGGLLAIGITHSTIQLLNKIVLSYDLITLEFEGVSALYNYTLNTSIFVGVSNAFKSIYQTKKHFSQSFFNA